MQIEWPALTFKPINLWNLPYMKTEDPFISDHEKAMNNIEHKNDSGAHYRKTYRGIKLDPARICKIYSIHSMCMQFIVKKGLAAGLRGHKTKKQDLLDIINAANRELEMMEEDIED